MTKQHGTEQEWHGATGIHSRLVPLRVELIVADAFGWSLPWCWRGWHGHCHTILYTCMWWHAISAHKLSHNIPVPCVPAWRPADACCWSHDPSHFIKQYYLTPVKHIQQPFRPVLAVKLSACHDLSVPG